MKALLAVFVLAFPLFARGGGLPDEPFRSPPDERFLVSASPYYQQPERAIKNRVAYFKKQDKANHFCLIGYKWRDGNTQVWLHWLEDGSLVQWDGSLDREIREASLMDASDGVRLAEIATDGEDPGLGGARVTSVRAWHQLADDCEQHGQKYVIAPFVPDGK
ncbi:hypothetical protein [Achromobacter arsenitoxydans]|uniref:Uncharacterized protein n=1 Tax=Achromobacter arsenitoxydans SY8 TaxID=477184 RepID=H0F0J5_9BURK|nr:hypothetical protein [Achromobacter arsenitoxydans]EHK68271.1 hypothetical protein KYC_01490 [Achromobacter arsenitoxydans SY8]